MPSDARKVARHLAVALGVGLLLFSSLGASCSPRVGSPFAMTAPVAPPVLQAGASAQDIAAAINANTMRVRTYQAPSATIASPESIGLPLVSASLAAEAPRRLRVRATTALTGPEIDLGSNDERFWVWARRNEPPATYTATHAAWDASAARTQLPLDPARVLDALGLVSIDATATLSGPTPRDDGTLELNVITPTPAGNERRALVVEGTTALVREQHHYDAAGSLVASVYADRYRYDPTQQVALPERVRVLSPSSQLDLTINTGPVTINAPLADGGQLWAMPAYDGYPLVELAGAVGARTAAANAFDLANASARYGAMGPGAGERITRSFTDTGPGPEPNPPASFAGTPPAATTTPSVFGSSPVATSAPPAPAPATGFVGLPRGGRPVTLPR